MKLNKYSFFIRAIYFFSILSWFLLDYGVLSINDNIKYVILSLSICLIFLVFNFNNVKNTDSKDNSDIIKKILFVSFVLLVISYLFQLINMSFDYEPFKQIFYLIGPVLFVFSLFRADLSEKDKQYFVDIILICAMAIFLYKAKDILSIKIIFTISFENSYSPFESIGMADIFLLLYCWYIHKNNKIKAILCAFICFLTFKRFHVVFMLLFLLLELTFRKRKIVKVEKLFKILKYTAIISPLIMLMLYSEGFNDFFNKHFGQVYNLFTMGRYRLTQLILNSYNSGSYINFGLGSTGNFLRNYTNGEIANLHCDVLRLSIETTYVGFIIYTNTLFEIVKKKYFSLIILSFMFITMSLSHIFTSFIAWIIVYIFIFSEGKNYD